MPLLIPRKKEADEIGVPKSAQSFRERSPDLTEIAITPPRDTLDESLGQRVMEYLWRGPVRPILRANSDLGIAYGARASIRNAFFGYGSVSARFLYGGLLDQTYRVKFRSQLGNWRFTLRNGFRVRGRSAFSGFGHGPIIASAAAADPFLTNAKARFRRDSISSYFDAEWWANSTSSLAITTYHSYETFRDRGEFDDDEALTRVFDPALVPGYNDNVNQVRVEASAIFDSRGRRWTSKPYPDRENGARGEAFVGVGHSLNANRYEYLHYGLLGQTHLRYGRLPLMLSLRARAEGVAPIRGDIPFTAYPRLGGSRNLRAFPSGRFRDSVALYATAEQHYYPWDFATLTVFAETGRVLPQWSAIGQVTPVVDGGLEAKFFLSDTLATRVSVARSLDGETQFRLLFDSSFKAAGRLRRGR